MKPSCLFFILLCTVAFSSCDKDSQSRPQVNGKILTGVWELHAVAGGMVAFSDPNNYSPGNGRLWTFSRGTGTDLNTGRKIDQFIFNNEPAESFELRNDTLKFYYGLIPADGFIEMYVKIADSH